MAGSKMNTRKPHVGDHIWFVEWCIKQGMVDDDHPEYGCEPDNNVMRTAKVATKEEAELKAREVYPLDQQGSVRYWAATFVAYDEDDADLYPWAGYWCEDSDDAEYYEGDD